LPFHEKSSFWPNNTIIDRRRKNNARLQISLKEKNNPYRNVYRKGVFVIMNKSGRPIPDRAVHLADKLADELSEVKSNIVAAYLFGSIVTGETRPLSDIDFAVLFDSDDDNMAALVYGLVTKTLGTDRVDFVNLEEAPLSLRYQVIKNGLRILTGDETACINFETGVIMSYLDFEPLRKDFFAEYIKAL